MVRDRVGNSLKRAKPLNFPSGSMRVRESIGGDDRNDFYSFNLSNRSSVSVFLNRLQADANLQLLNSRGQVIKTSARKGKSGESVQMVLKAGAYYLRVYPRALQDKTNYSLNLSVSAIPTPGTTDLKSTFFDTQEPLAPGNSFITSFQIQNSGNTDSTGFRVEFYLSTDSTINTNDRLLGSHNIASIAANSNTNIISKTLSLPSSSDAFWSGSKVYHVGVVVDSSNAVLESNESNNVSTGNGSDFDDVLINIPTPIVEIISEPGNTLGTAQILGAVNFSVTQQVSGSDRNDFYRFTTDQSGIFTANLSELSGDADVRLIKDINGNGSIDSAQSFDDTTGILNQGEILAWQWERGTGSESLRQFLDAGTYYVQVMSYDNQTSNYSLSTGFTPAVSDDRKFSIRVNTGNTFNSTAKNTINKAIRFWENIISHSSSNGSHTLTIDVQDDGSLSGYRGNGGGTAFDANGLTTSGNVRLSSLAVSALNINPNQSLDLLIHEFGHVLQLVGSGIFVNQSTGTYNGSTYAGWAYGELLGTYTQTAVPMSSDFGAPPGSSYNHWSEEVFGNETMSNVLKGASGAVSQLSIAALRDVGWNVNYGGAQPYTLPKPGGMGNTTNPLIHDFGTFDAGKREFHVYYQAVNSENTDHFYRVNFNRVGTLNLKLSNLTDNANMRVIHDGNNNGLIDSGEVIETATNLGSTLESINLSNLAAGTYFINVYPDSLSVSTDYKLDLEIASSNPLIGNNLTSTISDFGNTSSGNSNSYWYGSSVDNANFDDLFRFSYSGIGDVTLSLSNLTDNADIRLIYDANSNGLIDVGEVVETSTGTGTTTELINRSNLNPGNYFVHVYRNNLTVNTSYRLDLTLAASEPPITNTLAPVTFSFDSMSPGNFYNFWYGFSVGNTNIDDLFRLNLNGTSTLNLSLSNLTDNADIRLIYDANNNGLIDAGEVIATSANTGTTIEGISRSGLLAGTYYAHIYRYGSVAYTSYKLDLSASVS